jgi:hypothetical protein
MTKLLEQAMAKVAALPAETQEKIGEELLAHLDKVKRLRGALEKGISSLDRNEGKELNMSDVIGRARREYGSR